MIFHFRFSTCLSKFYQPITFQFFFFFFHFLNAGKQYGKKKRGRICKEIDFVFHWMLFALIKKALITWLHQVDLYLCSFKTALSREHRCSRWGLNLQPQRCSAVYCLISITCYPIAPLELVRKVFKSSQDITTFLPPKSCPVLAVTEISLSVTVFRPQNIESNEPSFQVGKANTEVLMLITSLLSCNHNVKNSSSCLNAWLQRAGPQWFKFRWTIKRTPML